MTTEERLDTLEGIQADIRDLITVVVEDIEENRKRIEQNEEILAEVRRENRQTRRIWIAFAKYHGWPEDLEE